MWIALIVLIAVGVVFGARAAGIAVLIIAALVAVAFLAMMAK
jgi:hypothetical protein